ncbi:chromate transporter [Halopseudomonas xinjiangensis]|uniref:Chromate transporter n=1 Tax=Halopseudomonas xinjiangensis TaxID=487184 RepID=A0A1H1T468_9GAMM|nr:chromate efflux transporter [Halopseudomonas xinjiangensis]SDS54961.1 chromate transporter [Halopseudomonas xinjiangensis]
MIDSTEPDSSPWSVFRVFLRLGLTSFGGPVAHLGYFHEEFVTRRRWLSAQGYADLVALCQFLPGPASSQVGMAVGLSRCGYAGALAAWLGFTLPSALALILFALGIARHGEVLPAGTLQGLKIAAVAVVAQAVWDMARKLCPDGLRAMLMVAATCTVLLIPYAWSQLVVIAVAGVIGLLLFKPDAANDHDDIPFSIGRPVALACLVAFFALLIILPLLSSLVASQSLDMVDAFYRAGALVFGGGHVVLPLLQAEVVPTGWVSDDAFLAGYGGAQAVPGPLFTFAAFLGASINGWSGGLLGLLAIFAPSFLLVVGALPYWQQLRQSPRARAALTGINAAVVGLLLAALYDPVFTSAIREPADFALAVVALVALLLWKLPAWLVVLACGAIASLLARF